MTESNKGNVGRGRIAIPEIQANGIGLHEYEVLLRRAKEEVDKSEFSLSIIMSHASIEICTEWAFKLLFSFKGIEYLYDAIVKPSWRYNNMSSKNWQVRRLYSSLSGEAFDNTNPLWNNLDLHMEKRHMIAHRGVQSTRQEAEFSIEVASNYIAHITKTIEAIKPTHWGD